MQVAARLSHAALLRHCGQQPKMADFQSYIVIRRHGFCPPSFSAALCTRHNNRPLSVGSAARHVDSDLYPAAWDDVFIKSAKNILLQRTISIVADMNITHPSNENKQ